MLHPATIDLVKVIKLPIALLAPFENYVVGLATEASQDYLRSIAMRDSLRGLAMTPHVVTTTRSLAQTLMEKAHTLHADFIIMGSHGRTGLAHTMLGSVAEEMARLAAVPTLMLRPRQLDFDQAQRHSAFRVLIPLDGSLLAEQVLTPALTITRWLHGTVRLLRVLPTPSPDAAADRQRLVQARAYLQSMAERIEHEGLHVEQLLTFGDPAIQIRQQMEAGENACDLLAIATYGRLEVERLFLGSVTTSLLQHAHCPLLIVRPTMPPQAKIYGVDDQKVDHITRPT